MARTDPVRERLLGLVRASPGVHVRRVSVLMGLSWNGCLHHLRCLEAAGAVVHRKVGSRLCWYDAGHGAFAGKAGAALLGEPRNLRVARFVAAEPGRNQAEVAKALGLAPSAVHRRVCRMEAAGLLERRQGVGHTSLYPGEGLGDVAARAGFDLAPGTGPEPGAWSL